MRGRGKVADLGHALVKTRLALGGRSEGPGLGGGLGDLQGLFSRGLFFTPSRLTPSLWRSPPTPAPHRGGASCPV